MDEAKLREHDYQRKRKKNLACLRSILSILEEEGPMTSAQLFSRLINARKVANTTSERDYVNAAVIALCEAGLFPQHWVVPRSFLMIDAETGVISIETAAE
jgi:hypothetical protein